MPDLTDRQLGPYRIQEYIGSGLTSDVYKAYHVGLKKSVAVAVLSHPFLADEVFVEQCKNQAQVLAELRHPNIVQFYEFECEDNQAYLVMEYLEGGSLRDRLGKPLDLEFALQTAIEVADALNSAHQNGVVHQDVKPANILFNAHGHAVLVDFALATNMEEELYEAGVIVGTPAYMAPEQANNQVDARSDIYALGATLYQMVTGHVPFDADFPLGIILKQIHEPVPPPHEFNPDLPDELEQVILRAMAKAPSDRYQSAGDMRDALEEILEELGTRGIRAPGSSKMAVPPQDLHTPRRIEERRVFQSPDTIKILLEPGFQKLTPSCLANAVTPYLSAITDFQHIIDELHGREHKIVVVTAIEQHSPISVSLEGAAEAVEVLKTTIVPWRRQHSETMAHLAEMDKAAEIESKKAEILEKRARAQKDRAEAEKVSAEAAKQREEAEKLRLENERLRTELHRDRVQLALDILAQIAPNLSEVERAAYLVKLLPPVEVLTSSELEVLAG